MSTRMRDSLMRNLGELRHEPTDKRVRARLADRTVIDSTRAVLVWEPRRVVASYAVPVEDVLGTLIPTPLVPATVPSDDVGFPLPDVSKLPVLDPRIPFAVHTADGDPVGVRGPDESRLGAGFRPADPDLAGHVILDFASFDAWFEEDEPIVSHPRDPFHRIDVLRSSRHVRITLDGYLLAETTAARLLFETMLPVRYYIPREDVRVALRPSPTRTYCAYKGEASYWSALAGERVVNDLVWSYERPLHDAADVSGMLAFFDERVDLVLDGVARDRPVTPWS
jgi:uncharacterized protein (DUF427 family)